VPSLPCDVGRGTVTFKGGDQRKVPAVCDRYDYGDQLPMKDAADFLIPLPGTAPLDEAQSEARQCMYIHVEAAIARARRPDEAYDSQPLIEEMLVLASF
jgi:hypothetical protein